MSRKVKMFTGNLGDVDLRLLRVFRLVVECNGFAGAETQLGISKSTISKHISDLENRVGVRLCLRGRSGFATTMEGQQIYEAVVQLFSAHENFKALVNKVHSRLSGSLSLGFVDTIVTDEESPLLAGIASFLSNAPDVHLQLSVGSAMEIEQRVVDSSLHAGIVVGRGTATTLRYAPFYEERSLLYCGAGHPLFALPADKIEEEDLTTYAFVQQSYAEHEAVHSVKQGLHAAATADHTEAVALLILTGRFIGFLPEHYASSWVKEGKMRALQPDRMHFHTSMMVVTRESAPLSPVTGYLLAELESAGKNISA